jgi:DNA modification methylase
LRLKALLDLDDRFDDAMQVVVKDNVFRNHPKGKNPGDFLSVGASGNSRYHFATMPSALAEWTLKATLPLNGTCLDPFMGTGTTGVTSLQQGGRFIGVDLDVKFISEFVENTQSFKSAARGSRKASKTRG